MSKKLFNSIQTKLKKLGVKEQTKLLVAVSGGVDSMVLLHVLKELRYDIGAIHCNFKLREVDADLDEQLVRGFCDTNNIPLICRAFDTKDYASQNGISIQMAARELRYAFFKEVLKKQNYAKLVTAHHNNDDIETSIAALLNANFYKGISGIPERRKKVIRPILNLSKEKIYRFATEYNVPFREDLSNDSVKYQRNYIRKEIVPLFENVNPDFLETFQKFKSEANLAFSLLDHAFEKFEYRGKRRVPLNSIDKNNQWLLWMWWKDYGGNWSQFEELQKAIFQNKSGLSWNSSSSGCFKLGRTFILFNENETAFPKLEELITIEKGVNSKQIDFSVQNKDQVFLDADKIKGKLEVKQWEKGMRFTPFGMKGSKLLSDYFTDEKVDFGLRQQVPILTDSDGIVWVVGFRMDERFRISKSTKQIWKMKRV